MLTLLHDTMSWASLSPPELRQRAEQACMDGDREALWALTEAYFGLQSESGRTLSRHTRRAYQQSIDALLDRWSGDAILHPVPADAVAFLDELTASGASASTRRVRLAGLRALYRALVWSGAVEVNPFDDVPATTTSTAEGRRERRAYSDDDLVTLLRAADPMDRVMILLCADTGLRVSECVALRWSDIDLARGRIVIRRGGKVRTMPLLYSVVNALRTLPADRGERVLSYGSDTRARQRLQQLCERAGVPYRGITALRRKEDRSQDQQKGSVVRGDDAMGRVLGVPDYQALRRELKRVLAESQRTGRPPGVLIIHLDDLAHIADQYGREVGEAILKAFAGRINRLRRSYDVVAQYPVSRFCIILNHLGPKVDLAPIVQRFQRALHADPVNVQGRQFRVKARIDAAIQPEEASRLIREVEDSLQETDAESLPPTSIW